MENKRKLRIMLSSNAHYAKSGYSQQVAEFLPYWLDSGYDVAMSAFFGFEGSIEDFDIKCPSGKTRKLKVYPKMAHTYGSDAMMYHSKDFSADVTFTLQDIWVLDPNHIKGLKKWVPIVPIDHEPTPMRILELLKYSYRIVSYSKFGERQLKDDGFSATYIPHTVDTKVFTPQDKAKIREEMKIPNDVFVFGMVAANKDNPPRKGFQEALDAFKLFVEKHPKSIMYFHAQLEQQGGFPIKTYSKFLGIEGHIRYTNEYDSLFKITKPDMARIYSAFDCLVAPSTNEGFGVPIIEAQACGVPVITQNFTAMRDLVIDGKTGYLLEPLYKRYSQLGSYIGVPDHKAIYDAMEKVYKVNRVKMGKKAVAHIKREYDTETVYNKHWEPLMKKLESECLTD